MEFLKFVTNVNALPFIIIILILLLAAISIYGFRTCCRSEVTSLVISESVDEEGSTWSNPLIEHSAKDTAPSSAKMKNDHFNCGVTPDSRKNRNKFIQPRGIRFPIRCDDVSISSSSSKWKDISQLRERAMPFQWTDRWFCRRKKTNIKFNIGEDLQDLEESSLDLLICKLDSLVLTFKSSDASRSSATSLSSINMDNIMAESEKCSSTITIN